MARLRILPDDRTVEMDSDETILEASLGNGIPHTHVCGGFARCSTCRVVILEGEERAAPRTEAEEDLAQQLELGSAVRLACQTKATGDLTVRRLVLDDEDITLTNAQAGAPETTGTECHVAILMADIRNFTVLSSTLLPYDIIHFLNRYFHEMGTVIRARGGTIDNYMGDGLLAVFGADSPEAAELRAVRAGLGMLERMEGLNDYLHRICPAPIRIGVGIHSGTVVVGTIGSGEDRRKTVIGDVVNVTSRVESANKELGTDLLVSQTVYDVVRDRVTRGRRADVTLKGKKGTHTLHEITAVTG